MKIAVSSFLSHLMYIADLLLRSKLFGNGECLELEILRVSNELWVMLSKEFNR